jgi:chemotaxis protein CheY-P-specific phosphatase CheC
MQLNTNERKIAQIIIKLGLDEAAKSLQFFTMAETRQELDGELSTTGSVSSAILARKTQPIFLLTTKLEGELRGIAYLLFTQEEVDALMRIRYADQLWDQAKFQRKRDGLILEIDNIITASVMSQFANHFGYNTYGGTPRLDIISNQQLAETIEQGIRNNEFTLEFNAKLVSEGVNINANFVWFLDKSFIEGIKKCSLLSQFELG